MAKLCTINSLDKVMLKTEPTLFENQNVMLANERFHFQVCIAVEENVYCGKFVVESDLNAYTTIRIVRHVPSMMPTYDGHDDYILSDKPGLYPDVLEPQTIEGTTFFGHSYTCAFITVDGTAQPIQAGNYTFHIKAHNEDAEAIAECEYHLEVLPACLPENDLIITNWIHYDCIAQWHKVKVFSSKFYRILGKYLHAYVKGGKTMLLVPLFTPPLDTKVGSERMTVQLVNVNYNNGSYAFDFSPLKAFIDFAKGFGIRYWELSHLFSQWGARHCPKIVVKRDGKRKKCFGWNVTSESEEYLEFLDAFLPQLYRFLVDEALEHTCFLHLSDEPNHNHLPIYRKLSQKVKSLCPLPTIDATSALETAEENIIDYPIAANSAIDTFLEHGYNPWVYYCCVQYKNYVSNRLFNVPCQRTRIIGMQMYLADTKGFLHWGYNFYKKRLSVANINPYEMTDAGGAFASGDSFCVYPYANGVHLSLREEVFYDGIQDYLALKRLEALSSKEHVKGLLRAEGINGYKQYPRSSEWHIDFRKRIYKEIEIRYSDKQVYT